MIPALQPLSIFCAAL